MYGLELVFSALFNRDLISNLSFPENLIIEDNVLFTEAIFTANRILF